LIRSILFNSILCSSVNSPRSVNNTNTALDLQDVQNSNTLNLEDIYKNFDYRAKYIYQLISLISNVKNHIELESISKKINYEINKIENNISLILDSGERILTQAQIDSLKGKYLFELGLHQHDHEKLEESKKIFLYITNTLEAYRKSLLNQGYQQFVNNKNILNRINIELSQSYRRLARAYLEDKDLEEAKKYMQKASFYSTYTIGLIQKEDFQLLQQEQMANSREITLLNTDWIIDAFLILAVGLVTHNVRALSNELKIFKALDHKYIHYVTRVIEGLMAVFELTKYLPLIINHLKHDLQEMIAHVFGKSEH